MDEDAGRVEEAVEFKELRERLLPTGAMRDAHRAVHRLFEVDVAEKTDFDDATLRLLVGIRFAKGGVIRAKEISTQLRQSTSHISRLVDRSEASGLIARRADPSDRRAQHLVLTTRGKDVLDAYIPHALALLDGAIFAPLSSAEVATLVDLLRRVENAASELLAERER